MLFNKGKNKMNYLTQKQKYQITYMAKEGLLIRLFEGNGNELNWKILDSRNKGIGIIEIKEL